MKLHDCPQSDAARFHSYRTYLQIQMWLRNDVNPDLWEWWSSSLDLLPSKVMSDCASPPPSHSSILSLVLAKCSQVVKVNAALQVAFAKKQVYNTLNLCKHCSGISRENRHSPSLKEDEEENVTDEVEDTLDRLRALHTASRAEWVREMWDRAKLGRTSALSHWIPRPSRINFLL